MLSDLTTGRRTWPGRSGARAGPCAAPPGSRRAATRSCATTSSPRAARPGRPAGRSPRSGCRSSASPPSPSPRGGVRRRRGGAGAPEPPQPIGGLRTTREGARSVPRSLPSVPRCAYRLVMESVRVRGCVVGARRRVRTSPRQADASRRRNGPRKPAPGPVITVRLSRQSCLGPDVRYVRPRERAGSGNKLRKPQQAGVGTKTRSAGRTPPFRARFARACRAACQRRFFLPRSLVPRSLLRAETAGGATRLARAGALRGWLCWLGARFARACRAACQRRFFLPRSLVPRSLLRAGTAGGATMAPWRSLRSRAGRRPLSSCWSSNGPAHRLPAWAAGVPITPKSPWR